MPDNEEDTTHRTVWYDVGIIGAVLVFSVLVYDAGWFADSRATAVGADRIDNTTTSRLAGLQPLTATADQPPQRAIASGPGSTEARQKEASGWIRWSTH